jgi:hypothetical protein
MTTVWGAVVPGAPAENDYVTLTELASASGTDLIGFLQGGTGAVLRKLQERERAVVYASDFYSSAQRVDVAAGTALVDVTVALQTAIAYAKTLIAPHFVLDPGIHLTSDTIQFDLPDGSTIDFFGRIESSVSNKSAIIIGKASANTFQLNVTGIKVERTSTDYTGTSIGIELLNLAWCDIDIRACSNFRVGVKGHGNGFGFTYNDIHLDYIHDNRTNIQLIVSDAAGGGYCNECDWYGGSLNHTTTYDVVNYNGLNLEVTHDATNKINNHRFYGPKFEDAHPSSTNTVAAVIHGENILIVHPRLERVQGQSTYEIQFTANSLRCEVLGRGFGVELTNINDLGTQNCYETSESRKIVGNTPNDAQKGLLDLRSTGSNNARLLLFRDASTGAVQGWINGSGLLEVRNANLTNLVSAVDDAAAATAGVPVNGFYRTGSTLKIRVS